MKTRTKRLLTAALALAIVGGLLTAWGVVRVVAWVRDLPNRISIDGDAFAEALGEAVAESYHEALAKGDSATQANVLREFCGFVTHDPALREWIRTEYSDDLNQLRSSADDEVAALARWFIQTGETGEKGPTRPLEDASLAEVSAEEGGETYSLIHGDLYRHDTKAGKLVFMGQWYDPDFFKKNYEIVDGKPFKKVAETGKRYPMRRHFAEDFEGAPSIVDLIGEQRGWSTFTLQSPKTPGIPDYNALRNRILRGEATFLDNRVEPSGAMAHAGRSALKCYCVAPSPGMVTAKASLSSHMLHFVKGDDVWFRGWYYVAQGGKPFTLMDLESTWIKEHPGMRICLPENGFLSVELKSLGKPNYRQPRGKAVPFPVGKWVELKLHLRLSEGQDGIIELWQDGTQIVAARGQTLPLANAIYDSLEIGISAHSFGHDAATLYVDDVVISANPVD